MRNNKAIYAHDYGLLYLNERKKCMEKYKSTMSRVYSYASISVACIISVISLAVTMLILYIYSYDKSRTVLYKCRCRNVDKNKVDIYLIIIRKEECCKQYFGGCLLRIQLNSAFLLCSV